MVLGYSQELSVTLYSTTSSRRHAQTPLLTSVSPVDKFRDDDSVTSPMLTNEAESDLEASRESIIHYERNT